MLFVCLCSNAVSILLYPQRLALAAAAAAASTALRLQLRSQLHVRCTVTRCYGGGCMFCQRSYGNVISSVNTNFNKHPRYCHSNLFFTYGALQSTKCCLRIYLIWMEKQDVKKIAKPTVRSNGRAFATVCFAIRIKVSSRARLIR